MSDITAISGAAAREAARKSPRGSGWADHPLVQLTLVRFREFMREPEALFWVFIFPILLAAGLGIAFRNRPADVLKIVAVTPELTRSLRNEKLLDVQQWTPHTGRLGAIEIPRGEYLRRLAEARDLPMTFG